MVSGVSPWIQFLTYFEWALMGVLFFLSFWSMALMVDRRRTFAREANAAAVADVRAIIRRGDRAGLDKWLTENPGVHAGALQATIDVRDERRADRAVRSVLSTERQRLERGLGWLATLGANAPFIGLFGTVLGIIRAFAALGATQGGTTSVMSGISQALYATAAGLFVAIPAVIAYNHFANRSRQIVNESDALKELWLARGES